MAYSGAAAAGVFNDLVLLVQIPEARRSENADSALASANYGLANEKETLAGCTEMEPLTHPGAKRSRRPGFQLNYNCGSGRRRNGKAISTRRAMTWSIQSRSRAPPGHRWRRVMWVGGVGFGRRLCRF